MRSAKEITESLEIAKGLCEGKTNESWNARNEVWARAVRYGHIRTFE